MSFFAPTTRQRAAGITEMPEGEIVSTYDRYEHAQKAVDTLAQAGFPIRALAIVGNGLRSVERITARMGYGKVAMAGAMTGSYLGMFLGLLMLIFNPENQAMMGIFLAALVIGAGIGMLFSVVSYALNKNRREFASITQVIATRYDLIAPAELVWEARNTLTGSASAHESDSDR